MKKLSFLFIFLMTLCLGQKSKSKPISVNCYLPTGEKCSKEQSSLKTMAELNKHFETKGRVWDVFLSDEKIVIAFKSFTVTPLYILLFDDRELSAEKIKDYINSINEDVTGFSYYWLNNKYGFKDDIKQYIEKKILDEAFLIETLGYPVESKQSLFGGKPAKCLIYLKEGLRIYTVDGLAVGFDDI